jgi:enamine deaminase RidA (YjgF/YER057c/UK114 family)
MTRLLQHLAVLAAMLPLTAFADAPTIEHLRPEGLLNTPGYSQVSTAKGGRLVFVSGQVPWDATGKPQHVGDLEAQTRLVFENVRRALAAAGGTLDDVVKITTFVKDLDAEKWKIVAKVRAEVLAKVPRPASTMIGVTSLVLDELLVEIEAYAVVPD